MKKLLTVATVAAVLTAQAGFASVAINFGLGNMYSSTNETTAFPLGGRINLLALESGTWTGLGDLNALFSGLTNSFTPAGVTLVGSIANDDSGGPGNTGGVFNYSYSGAFGAGDELMLVAYPNLTLASLNPGQGTTGFFFRTTLITDGSDIAYIAPADGGTYTLSAYTVAFGGSFPNGQFTSGAGSQAANSAGITGGGFTTIPEPSTYALLAMGAAALGGYVIRRRKRD